MKEDSVFDATGASSWCLHECVFLPSLLVSPDKKVEYL